MLKIQGAKDLPEGRLVIDEHVPFSFRVYDTALPGPYLWRVGNLRTSLLELKIDKHSNAVLGVTLTLYNEKLRENLPAAYNSAQSIPGLPIVNVEGFVKDRHSEKRDFGLVRSGNRFTAVLNEEISPERCYRNGRIGFFEGGGELRGIGFFDLTSVEIGKLGRLFRG